jgi:tRNA pseudouridine38-40 synthase
VTRFALTVEYDGRPFMGWQRQDHGPSVQAAIERAAKEILQEDVTVHAAGRTDAGVHALGMRAHLDVTRTITPFRLMEALNARLRPDPVAILDCEVVPDDWHARFSCLARHYEYRIICRRAPLTWEKGLAWRVPQELDAAAMHDAAQILVGRHDFTTFRSAHCQSDSPVKTLDRLDVVRDGVRISIFASARSFLHHQVRSMVGCLELVGQSKWSKGNLKAALDAADRTALGFNAPPDGLYFLGADYPPNG